MHQKDSELSFKRESLKIKQQDLNETQTARSGSMVSVGSLNMNNLINPKSSSREMQ